MDVGVGMEGEGGRLPRLPGGHGPTLVAGEGQHAAACLFKQGILAF